MNRSILIYIAAILTFLTFLGYLIGTFMTIPPDQIAMLATIEQMKTTMVPMPIGTSRNYMQILNGNNFITSLFLLLCAIQLFSVAKIPKSLNTNQSIFIIAFGLGGFSVVSAFYFFPIPTIFTSLAAILCIISCKQPIKVKQ